MYLSASEVAVSTMGRYNKCSTFTFTLFVTAVWKNWKSRKWNKGFLWNLASMTNRCHLVCVKFHLNWCKFAVAVAKCLGGSLFGGHSVDASIATMTWFTCATFWKFFSPFRSATVHIANSEITLISLSSSFILQVYNTFLFYKTSTIFDCTEIYSYRHYRYTVGCTYSSQKCYANPIIKQQILM